MRAARALGDPWRAPASASSAYPFNNQTSFKLASNSTERNLWRPKLIFISELRKVFKWFLCENDFYRNLERFGRRLRYFSTCGPALLALLSQNFDGHSKFLAVRRFALIRSLDLFLRNDPWDAICTTASSWELGQTRELSRKSRNLMGDGERLFSVPFQ